MNKALPWNINGVGFDAREAAREAARRQGKSLGEWLHGVIADHATERGMREDDVVGQDRIDAVTSRLERMSERGSFERRPREDRSSERSRPTQRDTDRAYDPVEASPRRSVSRERTIEPRRARSAASPVIEETEFLLEEAIDSMEHRAQRAERRTEDALASFAKMLETNEARRERERVSVTTLTQKLADIETRLSRNADESPIKGALARLEARLDTIGRRDAAESAARDSARISIDGPGAVDTAGPLSRLEDKLNAVLEAVATKSLPLDASTSSLAIAASRPAPRERRLGDAIAEIATRQRTLDGHAPLRDERRPRPNADDLPRRRPVDDSDARATRRQDAAFLAMQADISALTSKMDDMHRAMAEDRRLEMSAPRIDDLHRQIGAMAKTLGDMAARGNQREASQTIDRLREETPALGRIQDQMREIRDLISSTATRPVDLTPIETRLAALTEQLDERSRERHFDDMDHRLPGGAALDIPALEAIVRDLGAKMEAVQAPGAGERAIEALEQQIGTLASRFERAEDGLTSLTGLQHSMRDLFAHLEETRAGVELTAATAAREAVRLAAEGGRQPPDDAARDTVLRAMQERADTRTQSTLDAVHQTLEKVVDRLSTMEIEIADVRARPKGDMTRSAAPRVEPRPSTKAPDPKPTPDYGAITLGAVDPVQDPMLGRSGADRGPKAPIQRKPVDLDDEAGRADFIAAARRAAQAAQNDASVMAMKRTEGTDQDHRAGLIAKSKDYVATHKRPVLLSLAAIFVVLGTMAIMQRMGFDDGAAEMADYAAPAKIVRSADGLSRSTSRPLVALAEAAPQRSGDLSRDLTPSALPKGQSSFAAPIPGSDPIQTGSIQTGAVGRGQVQATTPMAGLPSFAAQGAAQQLSLQKSAISAGLQAKADAGNAAAEFELGALYADGKVVPHDLKIAANWYEKAAAQGLPPAQYRLASLYEKGLGVAQDKTRAKSLYLKAADAGNPRAMHNLAVLLADGSGRPDYEGASTWFRKAAQYGVHDSQYNLAILLARGLGVQQSMVQSYQWFAIAAAQNDSDAAAKRDEVAAKLGASDLAVAKALAASFHARTADIAATEVQPPVGGWDGASGSSTLNSARPKISSL